MLKFAFVLALLWSGSVYAADPQPPISGNDQVLKSLNQADRGWELHDKRQFACQQYMIQITNCSNTGMCDQSAINELQRRCSRR